MSAALESTPRIELLAAETRRGETWENQASGRALDRMGGALGFSGAPELIKALLEQPRKPVYRQRPSVPKG